MEINIRSKVWLEVEGKLIFSPGKAELLEAIEETGSLNQAAAKLKMSYRHAWESLRKIESRSGIRFIEAHVGGEHGGGSLLTPEGREFVQKFKQLQKKIHGAAEKYFQETFPNL